MKTLLKQLHYDFLTVLLSNFINTIICVLPLPVIICSINHAGGGITSVTEWVISVTDITYNKCANVILKYCLGFNELS